MSGSLPFSPNSGHQGILIGRLTIRRRNISISDLGSIGELLAAAATIATLIYLATQIRENTKVSRAESQRGSASLRMQSLTGIMGSSGGSAVFTRGLIDSRSLEIGEKTQFDLQFAAMVVAVESSFSEFQLGLIDDETMEAFSTLLVSLLPTPGGTAYWKHYSGNHPRAFREYLDARTDCGVG